MSVSVPAYCVLPDVAPRNTDSAAIGVLWNCKLARKDAQEAAARGNWQFGSWGKDPSSVRSIEAYSARCDQSSAFSELIGALELDSHMQIPHMLPRRVR